MVRAGRNGGRVRAGRGRPGDDMAWTVPGRLAYSTDGGAYLHSYTVNPFPSLFHERASTPSAFSRHPQKEMTQHRNSSSLVPALRP